MAKVIKKFIADNAIDESKIRLSNNAALKARNAADSGDVSILKVNTSDIPEFSQFPITPSSAPDANYEVANKKYVDDAIGGLPSPMQYKGAFDASAGNYNAITNPEVGWLYKISVAGVIGGYSWAVGDNLIVNKDVTGHPVEADIDKIDNTDAVTSVNSQTGAVSLDTDDISEGSTNKYYTATAARGDLIASSISDGDTTHAPDGNSVFDALAAKLSTSLAEAKVFVGSAGGAAVAQSLSGDATLVASGALTIGADKVGASKIRLENNTALRARNAANDADVNILKVNASDIPEFSQFPITPSAAPDANYEVANKKYVDDSISGIPAGASARLENLTLVAGDITAGYIDLSLAAVSAASISVVPVGGPEQLQAVDYTVSLTGGASSHTRITFAGDLAAQLAASDILIIKYMA